MDADGSNVTTITSLTDTDTTTYSMASPDWSPDGTKIVFTLSSNGQRTVSVINADGTQLQTLASNASSPTWSPDGTKIAFSKYRTTDSDTADLYVMKADGSNQYQLSTYAANPAWSPDGTYIAVGSITLVKADGSGVQTLPFGGTDPAWRADSGRLAFSAYVSAKARSLYVGSLDATEATIVPNTGVIASSPDWKPFSD